MNTHPIYESPIKERNIEKNGYQDNQCECCGKLMKEGSKRFYFHANTNWEAMPINATDEEIEKAGFESQGTFDVGSSCAKKFPKEFIAVTNK